MLREYCRRQTVGKTAAGLTFHTINHHAALPRYYPKTTFRPRFSNILLTLAGPIRYIGSYIATYNPPSLTRHFRA